MYVVKQYSPYLGRWHFQVGILYNHIIATNKLLTLFSRSVGVGGGLVSLLHICSEEIMPASTISSNPRISPDPNEVCRVKSRQQFLSSAPPISTPPVFAVYKLSSHGLCPTHSRLAYSYMMYRYLSLVPAKVYCV